MEEEQRGKEKKEKEVDFSHVGTIYVGSSPQTTPRTLDSAKFSRASNISRPDSGLPPSASGPSHYGSSGSQCSETRPCSVQDMKKQLSNFVRPEASNFDTPHILSQQEQPRNVSYPIYHSTVKGKPKERTYRSSRYPSIEEEDVERDGVAAVTASDDLESNGANRHRILAQQVSTSPHASWNDTSNAATSFPSQRGTQETSFSRSSPAISSSPSSNSSLDSSLPIDIPSRQLQCPSSSSSTRHAQKSPNSSDTSSDSNSDPTPAATATTTTTTTGNPPKKVLPSPTFWERVKVRVMEYLAPDRMMGNNDEQHQDASIFSIPLL